MIVFWRLNSRFDRQLNSIENFLPQSPLNSIDFTEDKEEKLRHKVSKDLPILNRRIGVPHIYNQNWNAPWRKKEVAYNDPVIDQIPHSDTAGKVPHYRLVERITAKQLKKIYDTILTQESTKYGKFTTIKFPKDYLRGLNKQTWVNRWDQYNPDKPLDFSIIRSSIDDVNHILQKLLAGVNNNFVKFFRPRVKKFGFKQFFVYRYRILRIRKNAQGEYQYHLFVSIFREPEMTDSTTYIVAVVGNNSNNSKINFQIIRQVGSYYSANFLLPPGIGKYDDSKIFDLLKFYRTDGLVDVSKVDAILKNRLAQNKNFELTNQYACFNADPNIFENPSRKDQPVIYTSGRKMCENRYDWYGRPKPFGVWDKPCTEDSDCFFFKGNKNYPNSRGRCLQSGYCELPVNMYHLGYNYYDPDKKHHAMCYNCNTTRWNAITELDRCCDAQKDRKQYPFLKSPDYAFKGDFNERLNTDRQRECKVTYKYTSPNAKNPIKSTMTCN